MWPLTATDEIVRRVLVSRSKAVVVTGGEPLMYNLSYFTTKLRENGIITYLETSGSHTLSGSWDWICLSPKKFSPPLQEIFPMADEYKVIIRSAGDFEWAEKSVFRLHEKCILFLQPEWSRADEILPEIVNYVKNHPNWRISLQSHKYMNIP
jgi:organic radical activating enzyme